MNDLRNCPDCGVKPGEVHQSGCDIEPCPECGGQRMGGCCDTDARPVTWKGKDELTAAAEEFDLYCYQDSRGWGNPEMHYGHIPCKKDHPEATLDLNRVVKNCKWDKENAKFVLKEEV